MKRPIKIKIEKELSNNILSEYFSPFDIVDTTTTLEIKNKIKEGIKFPYEMVKESFYFKNKELKDDEMIGEDGALLYKLIIK